jgi:hypothetical protein
MGNFPKKSKKSFYRVGAVTKIEFNRLKNFGIMKFEAQVGETRHLAQRYVDKASPQQAAGYHSA